VQQANLLMKITLKSVPGIN